MGKVKEQLLKKVYVNAYKRFPDSRISLCGVTVKTDENGREYFEIPAEFADNALSIGYEVGPEYIKEQTSKEESANGNTNIRK